MNQLNELLAVNTGNQVEDALFILSRLSGSLDDKEYETVIKVLDLAIFLLQERSLFSSNYTSSIQQ